MSFVVEPADIARAKEIRARRDRRYANLFEEAASDERWVGELGEISFARWLAAERMPFTWLEDDVAAAGNSDFLVGGLRVGVKTVKRKVAVRSDYTAQITERHSREPVDAFFFLSYEYPLQCMWLLGGCSRAYFLEKATRFGAGEQVHASYTIRERHAILNIPIALLTSPGEWLANLKGGDMAKEQQLATVAPAWLGASEMELVRKAQAAQPQLEALVQARLKESATITIISDDTAMAAANAQVEQIIKLRKQIAESDLREAATAFNRLHKTLTGVISAWDKLLEAREKSLSTAIVARQDELEAAREKERRRLQAVEEEKAKKKQEELRREAEAKAKAELDAAEVQRAETLSLLAQSFASLRTKQGEMSEAECRQALARKSDNVNQVKQDTEAAAAALDSLMAGNVEEAVAIMQFSKEAPPPPPPPPPRVEQVMTPSVVVREAPPLPSAVKAGRSEPHVVMACVHADGNDPECSNCLKVPRKFLVVDLSAAKTHLRNMGEATGGTSQNPNTTLIPGLLCWWERVATLRRTP
jgi:hypothetical protein